MRKRSKYRPYRRDPGAWAQAIGMAQPMTDDQLRDLGMAVHTSIERLRIGKGLELDFHTLAAAVNVSLVLCERGIGPEYLGDVTAAQDALIRILERQRATGRWAFDGPAYVALARAVELHEAQLETITRDGARAALLEVRRRVDRGQVLNRVPA
ncbi:MAG: hypothetical protein U0932_14445 [Thiobacillus sp.]|nr:hypothetical protein [Thiobacillus sp.]